MNNIWSFVLETLLILILKFEKETSDDAVYTWVILKNLKHPLF